MLTANKIAHYLVTLPNPAIEEGISNLKLQKLLYYLQGFHLAIYKEELFTEDIEAWDFGPVISETYHSYKNYGSAFITVPSENQDFHSLSENLKIFINNVYGYFRQYSAIKLMNMTHEETPWKEAYRSGRSEVISKTNLKEFFETHQLTGLFKPVDKAEQRRRAAEMLAADYTFNKELTAFTAIDTDDFYEG